MKPRSAETIDRKYAHKFAKSAYIDEAFAVRKFETPIKRSLSGFECEFMLINERGEVSNEANAVLKKCRQRFKERFAVKEIALNMLEVRAYPHSNVRKTSLKLVENVEKLLSIASDNGLSLLPLGAYPGSFNSKLQKTTRYDLLAKALGPAEVRHVFPRCIGFHYHYTLPRGTFDRKNRFLKNIRSPKVKKTLIDSYNLLVAADPVLTTFTQSSPFLDGKYHAKDSRMLFWRGGRALKHDGVFQRFPFLGELPKYNHTLTDLISKLRSKDERFRKSLLKRGFDPEIVAKKKKLDFVWNPVKINKLGTIEQRGMDMNHLDICLGVGVMLKFILRAIQQEFYHVLPSDTGLSEPFKLDGNVIFVPPYTHVRDELQFQSVYNGFSNKDIHDNCSAFFKLAKKLVYKEYSSTLKPIKKMIDKKESVSDSIIKYVKKQGYSIEEEIPQEVCAKIALMHSEKFSKRLQETKKCYEGFGIE